MSNVNSDSWIKELIRDLSKRVTGKSPEPVEEKITFAEMMHEEALKRQMKDLTSKIKQERSR